MKNKARGDDGVQGSVDDDDDNDSDVHTTI